MSATRRMYDEAFKKNAVKLKCASNKSVGQVAKDESFYSILKKEAGHHAHFHTREQARQAVFDFIERFYNRKRI